MNLKFYFQLYLCFFWVVPFKNWNKKRICEFLAENLFSSVYSGKLSNLPDQYLLFKLIALQDDGIWVKYEFIELYFFSQEIFRELVAFLLLLEYGNCFSIHSLIQPNHLDRPGQFCQNVFQIESFIQN